MAATDETVLTVTPDPGMPAGKYATTPRRLGLPRLDRAAVRAEQGEWLTDRTCLMRLEQRLGYYVKAIERTDKKLAALRPCRDRAALSLTVHGRVRAMSTVLGVSSSLYRRWRRCTPTVVYVPDAATTVTELARAVAVLEERRRLLVEMRDRAVVEMTVTWRPGQVARMIGRERGQVWQAQKKLRGYA